MIKIDPNVWADVTNDAFLTDEDWRNDYSGRGMYGANCVGITGNVQTLIAFFLAAKDHFDDDVVVSLSEALKTDNMGFDMIYYFPGWIVSETPLPDGDQVLEV